MYIRAHSSWTKHIDFMIVDLLCINAAYLLAFYLRFSNAAGEMDFSAPYRIFMIVINLLEITACLMSTNLTNVLRRGKFQEFVHVCELSGITLVFTTCYMYMAHNSGAFSRLLVIYTFLLFMLLDYGFRQLYKTILLNRIKKTSGSSLSTRSVFVVTEKQYAKDIVKEL